ncbi:MAG TPA: prenyltransferase [bacterium]|nr:prenyltransferase [bacterium]HMZ02925.1 prenyltransferase [bacterium]
MQNNDINSFFPPFKAWFMVYRILAVLVWAVLTIVLSVSLAVYQTGEIDWVNFLLTAAIASVVQGFPAHIVNEITDWKSGADQYRKLGEKSGGSKVLKSGLATITQLWHIFDVTTIVALGLMFGLSQRTSPEIFWFFGIGYFVCLFYTLPPLQFAYRPFAGEWFGGFTGIFLNMTGAYFVQTGQLDSAIILMAVITGLIYIAIMMVFHYLDYESDRHATPVKCTTIVFLGLKQSKFYVLGLLTLSFLLSSAAGWIIHPLFYLFSLLSLVHFGIHYVCNPFEEASILKTGKRLTYLMIAFTVSISVVVHLYFIGLIFFTVLCFLLHKKFGKLDPSHAV